MQSTPNREKYILVDCDGVCLDWEQAFFMWMHHRTLEPAVENYKELYNVNEWYGLDRETGKRLVAEFNASAAMGFLPPLRDAQWYIKMLAEKHGYQFVAVTSMSSDPFAQKLRISNLKKLFGEHTFAEYHILGCGDDKDEILMELSNKYDGCWWVEDKPANAIVGNDLGYNSILVEHTHNMQMEIPEEIQVVKNWEEIYTLITE
tara:strand:- start:2965 stop:3576 length:612 start_codon:yes stop_codon:yes gene_type:complete